MRRRIATEPFDRLWQTDKYRPYIAVVLGVGFHYPRLGLNPGFRWKHLGVIAALLFVCGVIVWNAAKP